MFADGKIYVPMLDDPASKTEAGSEAGTTGAFYVFKPTDADAEPLAHIALNGRCFGTPSAYNGKVYIQTTTKIYAFGKAGNNPGLASSVAEKPWPSPGAPARLQPIPAEVLLRSKESASFRVRVLDANGFTVEEVKDSKTVSWEKYIPPTARVRASMNASFNPEGKLVVGAGAGASAGAFQATWRNLKGVIRGRTIPDLPMRENFDAFELNDVTTNTVEQPTHFAYPPLPWIGARFKFDVREKGGSKVLNKTIDNIFFRRSTMFIGEPDMKNYTIQADILSEGNRRKMSEVGLINQRYVIVLKGNDQKVEINSNQERLRVPAMEDPPNFRWVPNEWYTLKARVDVAPDGSGVVRAKAWKRSDPEPEQWTLEVPHKTAHQNGSPGLFGFAPQDMPVLIDNISVTPNN
jgi:hypothetical protein